MRSLLGIEQAIVEGMDLVDGELVVRVRPVRHQQQRCPLCRRRCGRYDAGRGRRRWRSLDCGSTKVWLEADAPRVRCPEHGVRVAHVPWSRPGCGFTRDFEDQVAWLAVHASQSVVGQLMRVAWRSVGTVLRRVVDDARGGIDLLDGLRRIGIDETSYRRGHRYLTVVVCHDTGRMVWAHPGRDGATLQRFFDELGDERRDEITHISCDGANWIQRSLADNCPNAVLCMDAFHVVQWANDALDKVRRDVWNKLRVDRVRRVSRRAPNDTANFVSKSRWALLKKPENHTAAQASTLAELERQRSPLHRAWLLKEELRLLLKLPVDEAIPALKRWLGWAARCRLQPFVELAKSVRRRLPQIHAMLEHRLTNGRVESINAKIRVIQQRAFGFHDPFALIALAQLSLSGLCPPLPGRAHS